MEKVNSSKEKEPTSIILQLQGENKSFTKEEICELAKKGLQFEQISGDFETLKNASNKVGLSATEFINNAKKIFTEKRLDELTEKAGGNRELAKHILSLEGEKDTAYGFDELSSAFPEIKQIGDLPQEVVSKHKLRGSNILDEYLRYRFKQEKEKENFRTREAANSSMGIGPQRNTVIPDSAEQSEFLKGLWNK